MTLVETATIATIAQPIVAAVVGFGQIAVVAWGIRAMIAANADRAAAAAETAQENKRRHEEAMAAIAEAGRQFDKRLEDSRAAAAEIAQENKRRHEEAMAAIAEAGRQFDKRLEDSRAAAAEEANRRHEESMAVLKELIARNRVPDEPS